MKWIFQTDNELGSVEKVVKYILLALVAFCACLACTKINNLFEMPNNNPVEEAIESIVESKLGLPSGSLDFTPSSPEKH